MNNWRIQNRTTPPAIYREISKKLCDRNFEKAADQCKTRLHTLRRNFRLRKNSPRLSGRGRKFYDKLNEVRGTRPATSQVKIIDPMSKKRKISASDDQSNEESLGSDSGVEELTDEDSSDNDNKGSNEETHAATARQA